MNFFQQQDQARKQSRWLIIIFILAVLAIVVAIDLVIMLALGVTTWDPEAPPMSVWDMLRANSHLLAGGAIVSVAVIGLASLYKTATLRSGGGQVARQLGGTLVESDTRDRKRRRLRNVVEEIALASGVPVPEIYVLEQESGINAFAAGFTPSDAAVAVTRGALEKLDRNELQGVIAHEFSHIMNGDMRINIRLMGALFGILMLALVGRRVLIHSHLAGRSSRDKNGAVILLIAFGLMAIGYIGLFFGRWIKAALSRQREYLADASAVQFTRDPDSIGGALKKIAVYSDASFLQADAEEVSHMLFGDGRKMMLFSTHPPLNERISRVKPDFQLEELDRLRARIMREQVREQKTRKRRDAAAEKPAGPFDAGNMIDQIGKPDWDGMLMAAAIAASIPENIRQAAHSTEWAPEVLFYTLLDTDEEIREQQLLMIAQRMGADSEIQVRALLEAGGLAAAEQRLPLLEVSFPALKRRPAEFVTRVLDTVKALVDADGRVDVFEYLLARVITLQLWESYNPDQVKVAGNKSLKACQAEALQVMAVLARHGHEVPGEVEAAFRAGIESLSLRTDTAMPSTDNWVEVLDAALEKLDKLKSTEKEKLVRALTGIVLHDGKMEASELELLRATCDLIHVPLPLFTTAA